MLLEYDAEYCQTDLAEDKDDCIVAMHMHGPGFASCIQLVPLLPLIALRTPTIRHSLARALSAFPPAADRLKARSNGAGMDVESHNQVAVFTEAHATVTLNQLLNTGSLLHITSNLVL